MTEIVEPQPTTGGHAVVRIYAADTVITIPPDATLLAVADELVGDQVGVLVVGSMHDVEGVISERDVVRAVAEGRDPQETTARELASKRVVWCDPTATVHEVAELMMEQYVRHVLLGEDNRLVGIVSARDLLGAYAMEPD
jgi:CBS domain-containing protein